MIQRGNSLSSYITNYIYIAIKVELILILAVLEVEEFSPKF